MADGPMRARLDRAIDTTDEGSITGAGDEWRRCASLLDEVAKALDVAAEVDVRGSTGTSMKGAFQRSATAVRKKIEVLDQGHRALTEAHEALVKARAARTALDADSPPASEPGSFQPDPSKTPEQNKTQQGLHQGQVNAYLERQAKREAEAKRIADLLDENYLASASQMRNVHGEPDPSTPGGGAGGGAAGGAVGGTAGGAAGGAAGGGAGSSAGGGASSGLRPPPVSTTGPDGSGSAPIDTPAPTIGPINPLTPVQPTAPVAVPGLEPLDPGVLDPMQPAGTEPGLSPGLAAGGLVGGGLAAAGLTRALQGGLAVPGQATRGSTGSVKPIGSTSRAAVSGALGRGAAMAAGAPVTGRGAADAAGRGAGVPGQAVGNRGTGGRGTGGRGAGGRGAGGGGAGGRGAGGRGAGLRGAGVGAAGIGGRRGHGNGNGQDDEEPGARRDAFDDGQDWIDDEEGTAGVLD